MRVTAQTKSATRQRILETAKSLFAQQGFEAATTRDIARAAEIATGTLFNYFPTKEAIALCLIGEAHAKAAEGFFQDETSAETSSSLEEDLFAHVAAGLRKLRPYRKYLPAVMETSLLPLGSESGGDEPALRTTHLETVGRIFARRGWHESLSPLALQLYWTLYTGVLAFWAKDSSPRQEDTLALLDQSLAMFVGWLSTQANSRGPNQNGG